MTANRRIARTSAALSAAALVATVGLLPSAAAAQTERIINGTTAAGANWPSIVHVQSQFTENGQGFTSSCGGTLVAPHWVLTAAHCTFGDASTLVAANFTIISGRTTLSATNTGQSLGVDQIIRHPAYSNSGAGGLGNDVALLHLSSAAAAPPMELATQANASANVYTSPANVPNIAGWGDTIPGTATTDSSGSPDALLEGYAQLGTNAQCATALNSVATFDPSTMVCAGAVFAQPSGTTTTCHGDSGGPLVVFNSGRKVLWGVVSWGAPPCNGGVSAFARVAAFQSFLKPVFDELNPPTTTVTPPPAATPPPPPAPPIFVGSTQSVDIAAPRLDRFVIPALVRVRGGQPTRAITIKLRSSERATISVNLERRVGGTYVQLSRAYRVKVAKGTSRMTLPRWIWRMTPGIYRLRFTVTDAAGNSRTYRATIRAR